MKVTSIISSKDLERFTVPVNDQTELKIRQDFESEIFVILLETEDEIYYRKIIIQ